MLADSHYAVTSFSPPVTNISMKPALGRRRMVDSWQGFPSAFGLHYRFFWPDFPSDASIFILLAFTTLLFAIIIIVIFLSLFAYFIFLISLYLFMSWLISISILLIILSFLWPLIISSFSLASLHIVTFHYWVIGFSQWYFFWAD